jgi:hypothetical protein
MENSATDVKDTFVRKLLKMGIEEVSVPRVLKDISLMLENNPYIGFRELTHRLQLLGWSEIQINHQLLEQAKVSVSVEGPEI